MGWGYRSEQVENAKGTWESEGSAHAGARPFAFTHPAQPDARAPLPPSLTWSPRAEPPPALPELPGSLSREQPCRLLSRGEGTGSSRSQFPVLSHPLTHHSTASVYKRLTRYPLLGDFTIMSENSKEKKIQLLNNCTFTLLIFSSQKSAKSWQGTLQVSLT